ncbi:hypothetical protein [Aminipila sp.]|uniref:hypothetical protein n=1 Tax=Aminipila sp. TaxID=2060095 RepID=UPI00289ED32A|nr:hypothetical protein [Aminipila sp.]
MAKKRLIMILAVVTLFCASGCSVPEQETNSFDINLEQINKGIERFSKLKNGTLEVNGSLKAANNAVESWDTGYSGGTARVTFISKPRGYDFIEEVKSFNEKTGKFQYSATKQAEGELFFAVPIEQLTEKRERNYEWENISKNHSQYEPNAALKMMAAPTKPLSNKEYIESIIKEKDGEFTKYTLTASEGFATYAKEFHSAEENYIVNDHREIYWINKEGLLIKHGSYEEAQWTIDGITDTYISDITVELTGFNYKKLKKIGDKLP